MLEKEYWYAVLKDDEDDWYYGNTDLHTAMELAREIGPEAFIVVIDDSDLLRPVHHAVRVQGGDGDQGGAEKG